MKIAKRYDMIVAISTNIFFYVWDSRTQGPQYVQTYTKKKIPLCGKTQKNSVEFEQHLFCFIISWDLQQTPGVFFFYFLPFVWQRLTYREPALSTRSVGKTAILLSSNKRPPPLKGFDSMHPGLVGKAAKVGRNNANGVTNLSSKTLFESQSWKKNGSKPQKSGKMLASQNLFVRQR